MEIECIIPDMKVKGFWEVFALTDDILQVNSWLLFLVDQHNPKLQKGWN